MKYIFLSILFFSQFAYSAKVDVDVTMVPAGSFVATTSSVTKGKVIKKGDGFLASGIKVDLSTLDTGVSLRNKHAKDKLGALKEKGKEPEHQYAILKKAMGKGGKGLAIINIKGKDIKVKGTYKIKKNNLNCVFDLKLSDLDIKNIRYMGIGVQDLVTVKVSVPFTN